MMKSLLAVALLAVIPSCTVVGAATGYSLAGSHNASGKDHESSGKAMAAGAVVGLILDVALLSAAVSYSGSHDKLDFCGPSHCDGY